MWFCRVCWCFFLLFLLNRKSETEGETIGHQPELLPSTREPNARRVRPGTATHPVPTRRHRHAWIIAARQLRHHGGGHDQAQRLRPRRTRSPKWRRLSRGTNGAVVTAHREETHPLPQVIKEWANEETEYRGRTFSSIVKERVLHHHHAPVSPSFFER